MTNNDIGLRERKKAATREALSRAALRLALERGPTNVRVDDIAEAAGVSPRTYNNYFSSREQAIVAAIAAEQALRVAAAVRERPTEEPLALAVVEAVVAQYAEEPDGRALALLGQAPALRAEFLAETTSFEEPLAAAIVARSGVAEPVAAVLAAAVSAAAGVGTKTWLQRMRAGAREHVEGLVVVSVVPLADVVREALAVVAPALEAARVVPRGSIGERS